MSATTQGAGCGVVLGIVFVLLAQQLAYLSLSSLIPSLEDLIIGMVIGGVIFALIGWALGRLYEHRHPPATMGSTTTGSAPPSP